MEYFKPNQVVEEPIAAVDTVVVPLLEMNTFQKQHVATDIVNALIYIYQGRPYGSWHSHGMGNNIHLNLPPSVIKESGPSTHSQNITLFHYIDIMLFGLDEQGVATCWRP